jgi:hypothetical protein
MEMDLSFACNKYVPQVFIDEMKKLVDRYKSIKDCTEYYPVHFELRDGLKLLARTKKEALYYAFMQCISACPQGIELFMRCSTNYEQLATIYKQRKKHKLKEDWGAFCDFIESLPFSDELILVGLKEDEKD